MTSKNIWLIKNGDNDYSWCDSPDPSDGIDEADVTKYVRADSHLSLDEVIEVINGLVRVDVEDGGRELECIFLSMTIKALQQRFTE